MKTLAHFFSAVLTPLLMPFYGICIIFFLFLPLYSACFFQIIHRIRNSVLYGNYSRNDHLVDV